MKGAQMALTEIDYGTLASSEVMNNNFNYLDKRVNNISETIISNNAGINSNIASINSTISSMSEEFNKNIEKINTNVDKLFSDFSKNGMYITTYYKDSSWYREYFSDAEKKNRVWLEQGGVCWSISTTTFINPFTDANYSLVLGALATYFESGGITGKSKTSFSHSNGKGWGYSLSWYACGK